MGSISPSMFTRTHKRESTTAEKFEVEGVRCSARDRGRVSGGDLGTVLYRVKLLVYCRMCE